MKKILFLMIIAMFSYAAGCSDAGGSGDPEPVYGINLATDYTSSLDSNKSSDMSISCSETGCPAVYYEGTLNGTAYKGFSVQDPADSANKLIIYTADNGTNFTVVRMDGTDHEKLTGQTGFTIDTTTGPLPFIKYTGALNISLGSFPSIETNDIIYAHQYP